MVLALSPTEQKQAAGGAYSIYPGFSALGINNIIGDSFDRESLTPTGMQTIYTATSNDGAGTVSTTAVIGRARLTTDSSAAGDDESLRLSGLHFVRVDRLLNTNGDGILTSRVVYESKFGLTNATSIEGFVGFMGNSQAALAALPTTAVHMGIYWDRSANANFFLSFADGTTQTTSNTGIAIAIDTYIIRIDWTGLNSATIDLINTTTLATDASLSVTALNSNGTMVPHWFVQTETTAAKVLDVYDWQAVRT